MKKEYVFSLIWLVACLDLQAQPDNDPPLTHRGKSQLASLDISAPVGVFARTHFAGGGINYSWSHHRYGRSVLPSKLIGITFSAGADYYLGKKIKPAGYDFRYDDYLYFHVFGGLMMNPWVNTSIVLNGGPTMGIYKGNNDMGVGANLSASYFVGKNISIGPGITFKKHAKADALWAMVARVSYCF